MNQDPKPRSVYGRFGLVGKAERFAHLRSIAPPSRLPDPHTTFQRAVRGGKDSTICHNDTVCLTIARSDKDRRVDGLFPLAQPAGSNVVGWLTAPAVGRNPQAVKAAVLLFSSTTGNAASKLLDNQLDQAP
ncbi:hypothetical protein ACW14Y_37725 [Kitasatospora sp. cg17-2]